MTSGVINMACHGSSVIYSRFLPHFFPLIFSGTAASPIGILAHNQIRDNQTLIENWHKMTKLILAVAVCSARNLLIFFHLLPLWGPSTVTGYRLAPGFAIPKPPQIRMTMYSEVDSLGGVATAQKFPDQTGAFENDFVFKNGSDYVLHEGTQYAAFACEADYPITWKAPFSSGENVNSQLVFIYEFRISDMTPRQTTPENRRYIVFLLILSSGVNYVSVGLTCSSVEGTPAQETTIQLYRMGKEIIENEGKTVTVCATSPDAAPFNDLPPLVIPCRPSSPKLQLSLQKQISVPSPNQPHKMDTLWSPVQLSGSEVTFNPTTITITIQRTHLGSSIFGLYRCFVTSNEEDSPDGDNLDPTTAQVALVNVVQENALNNQTVSPSGGVLPFQEKMVVGGTASFEFSIGSNTVDYGTVKCCTGKVGKPPTLLVRYCHNPTKCQWDRESISKDEASTKAFNDHITRSLNPALEKLPSDCRQTVFLGTSVIVRCRGEDVDVLQEYVALFTPDAGGPLANRSQKLPPLPSGNGARAPTESLLLYEYVKASAAENVEVSRKMLILAGDSFDRAPVRKGTAAPNFVISNSRTLATLYGNADSQVSARGKILYFYEWDRDVYFSGEPLSFMCLGIQTFYAVGVYMRVNWRNGTKTVISSNTTLEGDGEKVEMFLVYLTNNALLPRGTGEAMSVALGEAVIAREEMDSVECFMPLAGSSRWDQLSRKVQVVPSVAPKFGEVEQEDVYFYVGEVNRMVSCTLKEGAPFPEMKVYRDGQPLRLSITGDSRGSNKTTGQGQNGTRATETLNRVQNVEQVKINFGLVKHSSQNVFQCHATNVKGVAIRTVRVFVIDKPSRTVPLILGILGVLGVTLLGLGVKHWLHKRRGC